MKRRVCIATGTRAEYGLLKQLVEVLTRDPEFEVKLLATGTHLSPAFGETYKEIEADGYSIDKKIEILLSTSTPTGLIKSMGLAMVGFGEALEDLKPELLILLGDRYEILAIACAALMLRIPIAHLHGGEITAGAIDDSIRHAVTKMSSLHFTATEEYKKRVVSMGESPDRVYNVGSLGIDAIKRIEVLSREQFEEETGFQFGSANLLVTYHPETLSSLSVQEQFQELRRALDRFPGIHLLFTAPNSDAGGWEIIEAIQDYLSIRTNAFYYPSLGQKRYFSAVHHFNGVVGNSSSGIIEVPSLQRGTVNVGDRQRGRLRAKSVIDVACEADAIEGGIRTLLDPKFVMSLAGIANPYGGGTAASQIASILKTRDLQFLDQKQFFEIQR